MRGPRADSDNAIPHVISGSLAGRVAKTLIYGKRRKSAVDVAVGGIRILRGISRNAQGISGRHRNSNIGGNDR